MARARGDPHLRGDRAAGRAVGRDGDRDVRLTGGEPLVRRDFPRLVAMLARSPGIRDLSLTTNGYLLERDAGRWSPPGSSASTSRSTRCSATASSEITRRDALPQVLRGLDALAARPQVRADQGQRGRDARLHRGRGRSRSPTSLARRAFQVRFIEFMPLDADHAWTPDSGADRRGAAGADRRGPPARGAAARAVTRPRASSASPTAAARSASSTRSPSRSAPTATGSASPPTASCAPACSRCTRPTCASRCAAGPPTPSSSGSIRDAVWRKELKHRVNEPGFRQPPRTMSAIGG